MLNSVRNFTRPVLLAASLAGMTSFAAVVPAQAQADLGEVISGIAQSLLAQQADQQAYVEAQRLNTVRGYRTYLAKYPKGAYRGNAERALVKLGASAEPETPTPPDGGTAQTAAKVEAAIGLSRGQRITIQKQLALLGYQIGQADGLWGAKTRTALGKWQKTNKLAVTGYITSPQVRLLARQAGAAVEPAPDQPSAADDAVEERLLSLNLDERREVQRRLTALGYRTYGTDGTFGRNTRRALAAWQADEGLRASGYLTADQFRSLMQ